MYSNPHRESTPGAQSPDATKVIPCPDHGDDNPTTPGAPRGGASPRDGGRLVVECPACGGPAAVPGRPSPPPHSVVRAVLARPVALAHRVRRAVTPTWRQPKRAVPLRGSEAGRLPDQVEALPRRSSALLEAQRAVFDAWEAKPHRVSRWLIDRAFNGTQVVPEMKGWPLAWWRVILLRLGCLGLFTTLRLRLLWTTLVHNLCPPGHRAIHSAPFRRTGPQG
jgi:hypothetical protein